MTLKITVLVSAGRHPLTLRPRRAPLDARAVETALRMPDTILTVVHAGRPDDPALRGYLGMGIEQIEVIDIAPGADPFPALSAFLDAQKPDLILTGVQAVDSAGSGSLPYALGRNLGLPILSGAATMEISDCRVVIAQALPKGQRRRLATYLPALVTVGEAASGPRQSAYAKAKRGRIIIHEPAVPGREEKMAWKITPIGPRRKRLKTIDPAASAAERLKAATGMLSKNVKVLTGLSPEVAAELLLRDFFTWGVLPKVTFHEFSEPKKNQKEVCHDD